MTAIANDLPTRWPRKPPKGARCDAVTGVGADNWSGKPVVYRCPNDAVETVLSGLRHQIWLCLSCVEALTPRGALIRNPRRKGASNG